MEKNKYIKCVFAELSENQVKKIRDEKDMQYVHVDVTFHDEGMATTVNFTNDENFSHLLSEYDVFISVESAVKLLDSMRR